MQNDTRPDDPPSHDKAFTALSGGRKPVVRGGCPIRSPFRASELVAWRDAEVVEHLRGSPLTNLAHSDSMHPRIDQAPTLTTPRSFGLLAAEQSDHATSAQRRPSLTLDVEPETPPHSATE